MDSERGTGRTTKQIKDAPQGAVFVCPPCAVDYIRRLAEHLGRTDLRIERPDYFIRGRWLGLRFHVVVDHAAPQFFSPTHWDGWEQCRAYNTSPNITFS